MFKVYDGPGKCRKKCPCGVYLHARSGFCRKCNYEFKPGSIEKFNKLQGTVIETYDKRGRGKKKCPQCEKYVGCRITECACGHVFELQEKLDKSTLIDTELREYAAHIGVPNYRVIIAPCGGPPKPPKSIKKDDVVDWINKNLFGQNDSVHSLNALRYRLRQLYSGKELIKVNKSLQEWYDNVRNTN